MQSGNEERRAVALGFLTDWFEHVTEGYVQFTYIRDGRVATSVYDVADGFENAVDEAFRRNLNGENVYIRTAPIGRIPPAGQRGDESYVSSSPGMWAEVDVAEAGGHKQTGSVPIAGTFEAARNWIDALPMRPTYVIHSGGGFHLYWKAAETRDFSTGDWIEGKRDASTFEAALQKRAREFGFGLDTNITRNFACLLRLPGCVNWKRAAGHVVEIEQHSRYTYDWHQFEEVAEMVLGTETAESYLYSARQSLPVPGGEPGPRGRNDTLKAMVAACLAAGKNIGEVVAEIVAFDMKAHDPPLFMDPTEGYHKTQDPYTNALGFVSSIMTSIQRQAEASGRKPDFGNAGQMKTLSAAAGAVTDDPFESVTLTSFADAWLDRSEYEPHLVSFLLPKATFSVLAGPPKSQKSLMLLELAVCMATGTEWFGFKPLRPLRVFLLQYEMPADMMRSRVHNFRTASGFSPDELERLGRNFVYSDKAIAPFNRDSFAHYLNFIRRAYPDPNAPPDVLVFDPLQNMFDGDENSNAAMSVFVRLVDELRHTVNPEASVIILHHANKTNRREMLEDPFNALRGASSLRGHYSSAIFISKWSEESNERRVFFDVRAGIAPPPKMVEYVDGCFVESGGTQPVAGESQLDAWNAERRRQRDRILWEMNKLAHEGELYAFRELSEILGNYDDLPGPRRVRELLSEYATRGYVRFCDGAELGLPSPGRRSHGYVVNEKTELVRRGGEVVRPRPTHFKSPTHDALIAIEEGVRLNWYYDDDDFRLELIDPSSRVEPLRAKMR